MDVSSWAKDAFAQNPRRTVVAISSTVVILTCVLIAIRTLSNTSGSRVPPKVYFANEETGELVLQDVHAIPALNDAQGNPTLVRVALYSLDGGKTRTAAYYEKYFAKAREMLAAAAQDPSKHDAQLLERGTFVRRPDKGSPWVPALSPEGQKIIESMPSGGNVMYCSVVAR